jgi:hypothetical protein
MLNSESERPTSADGNYNNNGPKPNSADLSVLLPDVPPVFNPPGAKALLRLLLAVRDRRRQQKDGQHNGA